MFISKSPTCTIMKYSVNYPKVWIYINYMCHYEIKYKITTFISVSKLSTSPITKTKQKYLSNTHVITKTNSISIMYIIYISKLHTSSTIKLN